MVGSDHMPNPVSAAVQATIGASGTATASHTVANRTWTLERMAAVGNSSSQPELRVYRNGTLIDATGNANADTSESNGIDLYPGDVIRADWSKGTLNARMVLTLDGTEA